MACLKQIGSGGADLDPLLNLFAGSRILRAEPAPELGAGPPIVAGMAHPLGLRAAPRPLGCLRRPRLDRRKHRRKTVYAQTQAEAITYGTT